ncbi:outer membrane protein assembly factor BamB family protein [Brevibacillus borstelensis]|uniref:outer membrane protein assembly factor BamB family protein n=1 Tax=Brevibacillus borstelensis TaxID=45462 RepID=UPI00057C2650|nr:PQQ-binding-like beta-propeller repeat protein [Brevibacillus borstelensis]MED1872563.1 PQQ-binding-like beta-propeller repeat protein [Brevibacillus borstelensis]WNF04575.1 PQQ-binding-like beta-propeller repeat protein [Brevibacillus borstelensis]
MNIRTGAKTKVALLALALALILPTAAHGQTQAGQPQTAETVSLPEVKTSVIVSQNGESKALILKGGDKYEVKWQNSLENEYLSNVVTDEQGIMYVTGADGFLYRLDQEGKLLGKSDLWMYWAHYLEMGRDGLLYVIWDNTLEYEWEAPGYVIVVDKTGKELRAIEFPYMLSRSYRDFDVASNGTFFLLTDQGVTAVDKEGNVRWSNKEILSTVPLQEGALFPSVHSIDWVESKRTLVVGLDGRTFIGLDEAGKIRWKREGLDWGDQYYSSDGIVYVLGEKGLHFFNAADGKDIAEAPVDHDILSKLGIPNDGTGGYYIPLSNNTIGKIDRTGKVLWSYHTPEGETGFVSWERFSDAEGNLYFADYGGNLYGLDKDGKERFILERNDPEFVFSKVWPGKNGAVLMTADGMGIISIQQKRN